MATYFIDYEGGNDANDGLSFANRWKTFTNGATAARIAPGDTIRVMASPNPTSIGSATWTNGPRPTAVSIASSTNATPIVVTTTGAHGLVAGEYVSISGHSINTNANGVWKVGAVGSATTFEILNMDGANTTGNGAGVANGSATDITNCMVKLASPVTKNIALCGGLGQKPAWTASTNVSAVQSTTVFKEGYSGAQIAIAALFTTGKAAYYTLPSTLDLSGYQQVSFWVFQNSGAIGAAGSVYLALCSDTLGATVVNTINIPNLSVISTWSQVVVDTGAALGSAIRSVALYVVTDNGAQTFMLDNIVASKASSSADSLTLGSLISKSDGTGDESWYAIQSINYDAVMIASTNSLTSLSGSIRGYYGTTETVSTYKRETTKLGASISTSAVSSAVNDSGNAGSPITYSGGWNRTDMSTQTGETWYDGINGNGLGFSILGAYNRLDKLNAVRFNTGYSSTNSAYPGNSIGTGRFVANNTGLAIQWNNTFDLIHSHNSGNTNININGSGNYFGSIKNASNSSNSGIAINASNNTFEVVAAVHNNSNNGFVISAGSGIYVGSLTANSNSGWGLSNGAGYNNVVGSGSTSGNTIAGVNNGNGLLYLNNFIINETNEISTNGTYGLGFVYLNRLDNTDGNNWVVMSQATINQQTAVVDSPATTAWKMLNNTSTYYSQYSPLKLKLGTIVCAANSLVTVTARMRREDAALVTQLVCPGGQIDGVPSAVYGSMTAAPNTWETVTITFTPTKAGAVDIYAQCYGNSFVSAYVCNLTASQA